MTRKDYELIAQAIHDSRPIAYASRMADLPILRQQWALTGLMIARRLADENPRFNRATFLKACGVES